MDLQVKPRVAKPRGARRVRGGDVECGRLGTSAGVRIRPLLITSIANMLPGAVLAGSGIERWSEAAGVLPQVGAALITAVGLVLAVRGYRLGVWYDGTTLTVRGLLSSRKIARSSIRAITEFPAVRWSGRAGRSGWTPIIAFAELGAVVPAVARRNEQAIEELRRWIAGRDKARIGSAGH